MTVTELQPIVDEMVTAVRAGTTVEASAGTLLNSLGVFYRDHATDPAAILAMSEQLIAAKGNLGASVAALSEAIVANTPAA